eukprot:COSAG01_NODE_4_length_55812_cov_1344.168109_52_plen_588_part_00
MGVIQQLDEVTINQIAAGEVIDRPASVVKELVENALDAGSSSVTVHIEDGGRQEIRVIDNGSGILAEDMPKAFLRHATSKLQVMDDLYRLGSFGFRGEALASISHVARVQLQSATKKGEGLSMQAYQGVFSDVEPVTLAKGTVITIATLFEDMPVRRRFLKTAGTELSHIHDVVLRFSLAHPQVDFILKQGQKELINTRGMSDLKSLLCYHYGEDISGHLMPVDQHLASLHVSGMIASPQLTYANRQKMVVTVNGRLLQSPMIQSALQQAYQALIPARRYPLLVLNLQLDQSALDVNIHPQKQDVKFLAPGFLYDALPKAIQVSLQAGAQQLPLHDLLSSEPSPVIEQSQSNETNFSIEPRPLGFSAAPSFEMASASVNPTQQANILYDDTLTQEAAASFEFLQIYDTYLVVKTQAGLFVLDQHAVHERILYEQLQKDAAQVQDRQVLLVPDVFQLDITLLALFDEHRALFQALNFEVERFGDDQLMVREIPVLFAQVAVSTFFIDLLEALRAFDVESKTVDLALKPYLQMKACKAAIKAGKRMSKIEVDQLLRDFVACPSQYTCPHGRPLYLHYDKAQLEKLFLRV